MSTLTIQFDLLDARAQCAMARNTLDLLDIPQFQWPLLDAIRRQQTFAEEQLTAALDKLTRLERELP